MSAIAMLVLFALAAYAMYARILPALLAVPLLALGIAAVAGAGFAGVQTTLVLGTAKLAPAIATVVFGALLSRVTLSTGIAETLVSYAAEFGGDRPAVLALALCAVVAVLFVSLTGLGAIIMVGSIVLPIMMTIGVPRKTAATLFLLSFALGFIFSPAQWTFYTTTFGVERAQLQPYAFALGGIDLVALVVFAIVQFRTTRGSAAWAVAADEPIARKRAPAFALIAPVVPIALFAAGLPAVFAFAIAAVFAAVAVSPRRAIATIVASAIRGLEDVAPAILLFMGIGTIVVATGLPEVKAALQPIVGAIAPRSWFAYVVLFGVFSPLALYRGPLNPFGVGIAVFTVLAGLGVLPAVVLVAAIMAVVQVQNVCDPTNTQNVWVANFTAVRVGDITKATLPYQVAVATCGTLLVVLFGSTLLGVRPFALATPPVTLSGARAASITPPAVTLSGARAASVTPPAVTLSGARAASVTPPAVTLSGARAASVAPPAVTLSGARAASVTPPAVTLSGARAASVVEGRSSTALGATHRAPLRMTVRGTALGATHRAPLRMTGRGTALGATHRAPLRMTGRGTALGAPHRAPLRMAARRDVAVGGDDSCADFSAFHTTIDVTPELAASPTSRCVVAIEPEAGAPAAAAADEITRQIARGWVGFRTVSFAGDAGASDCRSKDFAALIDITADERELGVSLSDCAGWPVDQWYVPRTANVRADALAALLRVRTWTLEHPGAAAYLFGSGIALDPQQRFSPYFYTLFKTSDGQMRAYVRPGGYAYRAGLRTNDIVEKLDGKYWWEYGTFQTQARAYDGKPHAFVIERGTAESTIDLATVANP